MEKMHIKKALFGDVIVLMATSSILMKQQHALNKGALNRNTHKTKLYIK
jgi:hypothetical protein